MFENLLDEVLTEYYMNEFSFCSTVPEHKFSLKHRLAMKKIFKRFERNVDCLRSKHFETQAAAIDFTERRFRFTPKRVLLLVIIILLATLAGCSVVYFTSQNFRGKVYSDNTELFPINTENCPTTIEEKYYLPEIPDGFEVLQNSSNPFYEFVSYINRQTGQTISLGQYVKSEFHSFHFNTEKGDLIEVEINGCYGLFIDLSDEENNISDVIWDNGDYILKVSGNFTKSILPDLAESTKILEK